MAGIVPTTTPGERKRLETASLIAEQTTGRSMKFRKQVNAVQVGAYRSERNQHYLLQLATEWS